jgi:hypothetical protein
MRRIVLVFLLVAMLFGRSATAADYTEIAHGDMSGNRLVPTLWSVSTGINRLIANTSP